MKAELIVGLQCTSGGSYVKASAIVYHPSQLLDTRDSQMLQCCAGVHSLDTLAPILVDLPEGLGDYCGFITRVSQLLQRTGASMDRVIFTNVVPMLTTIDELSSMISTSPVLLCIDCFGVSAISCPALGPSPPSDSEIVACIEHLCKQGHSCKLLVSLNVRKKLFLRKYGGPGYAWLSESIEPRLRANAHIAPYATAVVSSSLLTLLLWHEPFVPAEAVVEHLSCYICGALFVPEDHFAKFSFVYCSSNCLAAHRKNNWAKKE
jgi:hypothetical protein